METGTQQQSGAEQGRSTALANAARGAAWLLALAVAGALVARAVGVDGLVRATLTADLRTVALVAGLALAALVVRGTALGVLLGVLGHAVPLRRVVGAYAVTTVVSTVAPGGRAGGAPVNGLVVARSADADFEEGVAAVVAISALTNLVVGASGLLGVGYLLATSASASVTLLAALGVALTSAAVLGAVALWRVRDRAVAAGVTAVTRVARLARVVPRLSPPDRESVERRATRLRSALGRLREGSPRQIAALVGLLAVGHGLTVVALWLSFLAVGQSVSAGVLLAVIPAAVAAAVVPTPGGVGGVDVALVGLIATGTSAVASVAGAAVLVYRAATSGPALVAGGLTLAAMAALGWLRESDETE